MQVVRSVTAVQIINSAFQIAQSRTQRLPFRSFLYQNLFRAFHVVLVVPVRQDSTNDDDNREEEHH